MPLYDLKFSFFLLSYFHSLLIHSIRYVTMYKHCTVQYVRMYAYCSVHYVTMYKHCSVEYVRMYAYCSVHYVTMYKHCTVQYVRMYAYCSVHYVTMYKHCSVQYVRMYAYCSVHYVTMHKHCSVEYVRLLSTSRWQNRFLFDSRFWYYPVTVKCDPGVAWWVVVVTSIIRPETYNSDLCEAAITWDHQSTTTVTLKHYYQAIPLPLYACFGTG
jgi:hypothetical protein